VTAGRLLEAALDGCSIVVAADRRAGDLASALQRRGAQVQRAPALSIVPNADDEELLMRTRELIAHPPDIVVVTTGVGFRGWIDAAHEHGLAEQLTAALDGSEFIARGPKARGAIQQAGFVADWVAESETAAEVGRYLLTDRVRGTRIAIQQHGAGSDGLEDMLRAAGADVLTLTVYRWGPAPDPELVRRSVLQAATSEIDAVLFTSAPGAREWMRTAELLAVSDAVRARAVSGRLLVAAVGPITAAPLQESGVRTVIADRGRLGSLARCVIAYFAEEDGAPRVRTVAGTLSVRSGGVVLSGEFIPLSRAGCSVLGALFDCGGRVLTRDEISAYLPRARQNPHAVEMAVARIRETLGRADIVQTVIKRGYRLAVEESA